MISNLALAQQSSTHQISIVGSYPVPANGLLKRSWEGLYSLNCSYEKFVTSKVLVGLGFTYSRFQIDKDFLDIDTQGYFLTPYLSGGYLLHLNDYLEVTPLLYIGNTWIRLRNKELNTSYKENGISVEPAVRIRYFQHKHWGINFTVSYKLIFEPLGQDHLEDANTTNHYNVGVGVVYRF